MSKHRRAPNASCTATTKSGERCPAPALSDGSGRCLWHSEDPQRRAQAELARSVGSAISRLKGRRFRPDVPIQTPQDLLDALAGAIADCGMMPVTQHRATSIAALSREWRETFALREAMDGHIIEGVTS
jgi:hypothetical protein